MEYFYSYPEATGTEVDMLDAGDLGEVAGWVEAAGFDGFSLTEHPVPGARWLANGGHQTLDPFVALGFVAAATSRGAAERAQGWMPMPGGPELSATARTPQIADDAALAAMVREVQERAAELGRLPVDICWTYTDRSVQDLATDLDRHRERFGQLADAGVTCMLVTSTHGPPSSTAESIAGFGETYL